MVQTSNSVVICLPAIRRTILPPPFDGSCCILWLLIIDNGFGNDSGRSPADDILTLLVWLLFVLVCVLSLLLQAFIAFKIVLGRACGGFGLITSTELL